MDGLSQVALLLRDHLLEMLKRLNVWPKFDRYLVETVSFQRLGARRQIDKMAANGASYPGTCHADSYLCQFASLALTSESVMRHGM
ncbi:hypothetical protein EPAKOI_001178 [Cupriavidus sp. H18C2]